MEGYGRMKFNNGDIYDGEWKNNKRNGNGFKIYAKSGKIQRCMY